MNEEVRHFSLRKLSVGLASVLVGVSIFGASQTVKADTVANNQTSSVTNNAQNSDTQENGNAAESTFSNVNRVDNTKSNATQTQENEPKQVQAKKDQKQDSAPKTQEVNDNKDLGAEKGIVHTSPLQEPDNQSNTVTGKTVQHNTLESGQKTQSFNLSKNSQKLNRKVLATNLIVTSPTTNGGFDEATWGKLDVNDWRGSVQDGVYQLTHYRGDLSHVIVPNEADFEKAGKSTNGLQVGITRDTVKSLLSRNQTQTIAFSKTNNQKVKAIGTDWSQAFAATPTLSKLDGSNLDVSGVTDMHGMFEYDKVSDLTSLAHWDTSNVTNMSEMFNFKYDNSISDLTPLANWDVSNVTDMMGMFENTSISNLTGLAKWDTSKVTNMNGMFRVNKINNLTSLTNWKTSNVTDMSGMFDNNQISDLTPLTNWKTSNVTDMSGMFADNKISDLTPLTNWNTSNVKGMIFMFKDNAISDLTPLGHWNTSNVTDMNEMFKSNKISDLTPLANWDTSKVIDMSHMFAQNPDIDDLKPIANWNMSSITDNHYGHSGLVGLFKDDDKLNLININNAPLMQGFLKAPDALQSSIFITNNADLVKKLVDQEGQELPIFTKTAKRTIVFHFPDGTQKEIDQIINFKTIAPVQIEWPAPPVPKIELMVLAFASERPPFVGERPPFVGERPPFVGERPPFVGERPPFVGERQPVQAAIPRIIKKYTIDDVKASDWQLDTSQTKPEDVNVVNGRVYFKAVKIPHINGYKAYIVPNKLNPAMFMVSFIAVPSENKPSTPVEVAPSKPSAPADNPNKPSAPVDNPNKPADDLQKHVAAKLNSNDLGWTMPVDISNSTYTVEVPKDATIDLSDLVIAEPVHAQTQTQIRVNKRFKLSKKHLIKHLKHRKRVSKLFSKRFKLSKKHAIKHLKHRKRVSKLFSKRYASL